MCLRAYIIQSIHILGWHVVLITRLSSITIYPACLFEITRFLIWFVIWGVMSSKLAYKMVILNTVFQFYIKYGYIMINFPSPNIKNTLARKPTKISNSQTIKRNKRYRAVLLFKCAHGSSGIGNEIVYEASRRCCCCNTKHILNSRS